MVNHAAGGGAPAAIASVHTNVHDTRRIHGWGQQYSPYSAPRESLLAGRSRRAGPSPTIVPRTSA